MIDHLGITVRNFERSKEFYKLALAPISYKCLMEFASSNTGVNDVAGFGEPGKPDFWLSTGPSQNPPVHVAFRVKARSEVDAFYKAAIAAGAKDNGAPGLRPHYHENYYGAFVLDFDGHNVEAVCHEA